MFGSNFYLIRKILIYDQNIKIIIIIMGLINDIRQEYSVFFYKYNIAINKQK